VAGLKQATGQDAVDGAPGGRSRIEARFCCPQVWSSAGLEPKMCQGKVAMAPPPSRRRAPRGREVDKLWSGCAVRNSNFQNEETRGIDPAGGGDIYSISK